MMVNVLCDVTALPWTGILHNVDGCYGHIFCWIMVNVLCDVTALPWTGILHIFCIMLVDVAARDFAG